MIWEPREHLLDDRLLKDYLKRNPGAKRVLHPDPDYNPRVTAISSSPHTEASSVFAFLTLETDSTCCDDALLLVTRLKKPLIVNDSCHVQPSQLSTVPAQKPGFHPTTPQAPGKSYDVIFAPKTVKIKKSKNIRLLGMQSSIIVQSLSSNG